jgi:hypothetical protein
VYVAVIHGERDVLVPISAGRDAARRAGGDLVVVAGGSHSWLLRCPETLPAITSDLLDRGLGDACRRAVGRRAAETACYTRGAIARTLDEGRAPEPLPSPRRAPRYAWTFE